MDDDLTLSRALRAVRDFMAELRDAQEIGMTRQDIVDILSEHQRRSARRR